MKRFTIIAALALLLCTAAFAQAITEVNTGTQSTITEDVVIDLSAGTSTSELVSASFNDDGNLEVTYNGTDEITIALTGELEGTLILKNENADVTLALHNVTIKGTTLPAMQLKSETTVTIYSAEGENHIADSADNGKKGAITSSGSIILDGSEDSTTTIEVFKKHGLKTDGGVTVNGGNFQILGDESAEGNMISADLYFIMNDGSLTIIAKGNVYASESKGIKVNGVEGTGAGLGQVEINGGHLYISSVGKAITAGWKLSEDATTEDTSDDPNPNVYINGGYIEVHTSGTPYEVSDEESLSPEGIEAKNILYINGGTVYAYTTDDCLNATTAIIINGGYVYASSTMNDSIDSNGTLEINGGVVISMSDSMEQAFDCDSHANFTYTGGTYVGAGNGNNMPGSESTTAYSLAYGDATFYAGDQIAVLDSEGTVVTGFVVPYDVTSLTSIVFGSEHFKAGESYTIALGDYEVEPEDGLAQYGAAFKVKEEVVTMDLTDHTVSEGYIGMDIASDQMGGFGGQMPAGGPMPDGEHRGGFDIQSILSTLLEQAAELELPEGVTLPDDLDSDEAVQLALYVLGNYVGIDELMTLVQGSVDNGEFGEMPTPPNM